MLGFGIHIVCLLTIPISPPNALLLNAYAAASLSDRSQFGSFTVSLVCQGGIPMEYGQIRPLQVIEIREVNGRGERI